MFTRVVSIPNWSVSSAGDDGVRYAADSEAGVPKNHTVCAKLTPREAVTRVHTCHVLRSTVTPLHRECVVIVSSWLRLIALFNGLTPLS